MKAGPIDPGRLRQRLADELDAIRRDGLVDALHVLYADEYTAHLPGVGPLTAMVRRQLHQAGLAALIVMLGDADSKGPRGRGAEDSRGRTAGTSARSDEG